jgi:virulence factor Mce-like protein
MARREKPRVLRKDRTGANPVLVGALVLLAAVVVVYFGFTKDWPFSRGFEFQAVVKTSNSIRQNSPVRIAGVNVGKVKKIEGQDGTDNAVITMEINEDGLPIHKDARLKIRPRIFLEGNFFVDLQPGTPNAPTISDGDTIPVTQTATPVQIDQVLTSLQQDSRRSLQVTLQELGRSLTAEPDAAANADQSIYTQDKTAAQALNSSLIFAPDALRGTAVVNTALQGLNPSDLTGLVRGLARTGTELASTEEQLGGLVDNFNTTMAAFAGEQTSLRETVGELGPTVQNAYTSLGALNDALPNLRAFSLELVPGVNETQNTIDALTPWIEQMTPFVGEDELGGLVQDLQPSTASLAKVTSSSIPLLQQSDLLAKCFTKVILPTGDVKLEDGPFTTGKENYKEFWYTMVGLAGEGQNFDGNGQYVRFQTGGGPYRVTLKGGSLAQNGAPMYGNSVGQPLGTKPAWTQKKPPVVSSQPCYKQPIPDFDATPVGPSDGAG